MKKMRWLLVGLLTLVLALGVAACGDKTPTPGPNGDDPKPPVVTPGGDDEPPEKEVITVTGVENNKAYAYGSDVKPTFDKGTATLSRNSGAAAAYTSGTAVTQVGSYLLTVTHDNADTVSVRFSIAPPDTTGQITDEFVDDVPQADYFTDSQISFVGGNLTVSHPADSQAWGISRRKIEHVDVTEWPFVEVRIEKVVNCSATMVLRLEENADEKLDVSFDVAGLYYVDVKTYAEAHGWNMTDQTVWVDCNIVGNANTDMVGVFDYYKSAKEIAPLAPCGVYVDKTAETINTWKAATANIQWFDGDDSATAVITGSEGYGHFDKRVNFNTEEYPFLIVDVMQVVGSWAIKANKYVNYQKTNPQITLIDTTKTGKHEINLQKFFGVSENVDVLLEFYIVGKSDEKTFQLNGLETTADPITDIEISGTADGATVNSAEAGAQVTFDKGTATIRKDGDEAAEYISGTEITEVGSYVVTVKAGTFEHTISFTVVKQVVINTSGIEDGDIINIAWRDRPALTFDKGTATIRKDGSEATEYASGTEITEVGSYVITVTATGAETKTVSFTVFNREVQEGTFEDYCTLNVNTITANNSTKLPNGLYKDYHDDFYIMYDGAAMRMDMTTGNLVYAKVQGQDWSELIKSYTLTFPQSGYFVLAFKPLGGYSPDAMFQFQIKDISGDINYNAATKAVIDKAGVHHVYYEIPEALRGQTNKAITVLVKIQAGPDLKEIALHSLGLVNELPEDSPVIVDYGDDAGLTVSSCTKEVAGGGMLITSTNANATITKAFTGQLEFKADYNYFVLSYKAQSDFTMKNNFGFELLSQDDWHWIHVNYQDKVKEVTDSDGVCHVYFAIPDATPTAGTGSKSWKGEKKGQLSIKLSLQSTGKIELYEFAFAKALPADAD